MSEYLSTLCEKVLIIYRCSEHNLAKDMGRNRQTWLPKEGSLFPAALHTKWSGNRTALFLTACPNNTIITETFFLHYTSHGKFFNLMQNKNKLLHLPGNSSTSLNLAARCVKRCVKSCLDKRVTEKQEHQPYNNTGNIQKMLRNAGL